MKKTKARQEKKKFLKDLETQLLKDGLENLQDSYSYFHGILIYAMDRKVSLTKMLENFPVDNIRRFKNILYDFQTERKDAMDTYKHRVLTQEFNAESNEKPPSFNVEDRRKLKRLLYNPNVKINDIYENERLEGLNKPFAEAAFITVSDARKQTLAAFKAELNDVFKASPDELKAVMMDIITNTKIRTKDVVKHIPDSVGKVGKIVLSNNMHRIKAKYNAINQNLGQVQISPEDHDLIAGIISKDPEFNALEYKHLREFFQNGWDAKLIERHHKLTPDQSKRLDKLLSTVQFLADHTKKEQDYKTLILWYLLRRYEERKAEGEPVSNIYKKNKRKPKWSDDRWTAADAKSILLDYEPRLTGS